MQPNIVIRGGLVVDGLGGEPKLADVSIVDGRVNEIGRVDSTSNKNSTQTD